MRELADRIRILEEKHEYQDHTVETLNQVVIEQQTQLDNMQLELTKLRELLIATRVDEGAGDSSPHY